jgi:DNA (cytosine-5)-methyltransferase 1
MSQMTVLDCFCGAGIGAVGAKAAGFKTVFAFDNDPVSVMVYNKNVHPVAHVLDAKKLDIGKDLPFTDGIMAGFPCNSFSTSGKRLGVNDSKYGSLGYVVLEIIRQKAPKFFLLENVKGLASKSHEEFFNDLKKKLQGFGYNIYSGLLNASEYGVPQKRERVIIIGIKPDFDRGFKWPMKATQKVCIKDALVGLPVVPDGVNNHYGFDLRKDEKPFANKVPDGGNWKDLPVADQKAFMKNSFYSSGGKTTYLRKVDPKEPAFTIMSHVLGKHSVQLYGNRRFTIRESLRIQTAPDSFVFDDDIPLQKQYACCGGGIPSLLAKQLFESIRSSMK